MERITELLKQYRYGVLILLIGLGLMLIPEDGSREMESKPISPEEIVALHEQLENILSLIDGAGEVRVLLTESAGEVILYQQDTSLSGETTKSDAVVITDANRAEQALVTQVIPAKYQGAIVVCQGGDRASVRLDIVEAVSAVTGLTSDRIRVLKMK